jgi:hypothetical protein
VDKKYAPPVAVRYPHGRALAVNYSGGYYDLWKVYEVLSQYMEQNGYGLSPIRLHPCRVRQQKTADVRLCCFYP